MNPDGVSVSCDDGAHERCPGCGCHCHTPSSSGVGGDASQRVPSASGVGSWPVRANVRPWEPRPDRRLLAQSLSVALVAAFAGVALLSAIVLAAQGLL